MSTGGQQRSAEERYGHDARQVERHQGPRPSSPRPHPVGGGQATVVTGHQVGRRAAQGDEVATTGGILGKVTAVGEQFLTVEIANGVNIKLQKHQVAQLLPKGTVKSA